MNTAQTKKEDTLAARDAIAILKQLTAVEARLLKWPEDRRDCHGFRLQSSQRASLLAQLDRLGAQVNHARV
jgi:hypothetical protein